LRRRSSSDEDVRAPFGWKQTCALVLAAFAVGCAASGCAGLSEVAPEAAGLGAGAGTGVLTANPIVGVAVGLAVRLATDEGIGYVKNEQQRQVQQAIATAAGNAPNSDPVQWSTDPDAFYGALFGTVAGWVQVARDFGGRIQCREVLYTVKKDGGVEGLIDDPGAELQNMEPDDGTSADQPQHPASDWSPAASGLLRVAAICKGPRGWQWAVAEPATEDR
jgi:hypothetical protein